MAVNPDFIRPRLADALGTELQLGPLLGSGGFAAVFQAHDPFLHRDVAIKVLDPELGVTADSEAEFLREARIVAGVEHPHIVPLYRAESRNGLLYLVMRLLPGRSLADLLAAGPLSPPEAARIAHEVAGALAAAHARGVVHRDIKPDNILLDAAGHAIVTDFGISIVANRPTGATPGTTAGTPTYISPEQALADDVDGRADVYSLGVVLFEMLAGRAPFQGRNAAELLAKHIAEPPPKLSALRKDAPAALVALIDRMLAKDRTARPTSDELVTALSAARTPDALLSPRAARWKKRRRRAVIAGAVLVTAGVVLYFTVRAFIGFGRALTSGEPPVLDASGAGIPAELIAEARAEGSLGPADSVLYAFIPAGRGFADAVLFTHEHVIRRSPAGARGIQLRDSDIDVNLTSKSGVSAGYLIVTRAGVPPDTLYNTLGGVEVVRLSTALRTLSAKLKSLQDTAS
jgi:serine/threonine-protein kinase